jgi:hypothetical protein
MGYIINHYQPAVELGFSTLISRFISITNTYAKTGWAIDNLKVLVLEDDSTLIGNKSQNIIIEGGLGAVYLGLPVAIRGTSDSGLPVVLEVVSGPARIEGGQLVATGAGVVRIRATQAGNETWAPASVEVERTVDRAGQSLTWDPISPQTFGASPITLSAKSDRGLSVSYSVSSGPGTVTGDQLLITGAGTVVVRASQAGTTNVLSANQEYSVVVSKAPQTLSFGAIPNQPLSKTPLQLVGSASSGLPVTFDVVSGPATILNNSLSLTGAYL